jgi:autotransporter family porin
MQSVQLPPRRSTSVAERRVSQVLRLAAQHWLVIVLAGIAAFTSVGWGVTALQLHRALKASSSGADAARALSAPTLPPGSALPSGADCAAQVPASTWEPRPANATANHTMPSAQQLAALGAWDPSRGMDAKSDVLRQRVTGHYTGTTDQILQWVGCKWGIDPDIVRAQAVVESYWRMSQAGDPTSDPSGCPPDATYQGSQCYQSYGILQIKYRYYKGAFPMARQDTALNADYVYGWMRNCYEGWADYLYGVTPTGGYPKYHAGDIWGCLGFWYSGSWYDSGALHYIGEVQAAYNDKVWQTTAFANAK